MNSLHRPKEVYNGNYNFINVTLFNIFSTPRSSKQWGKLMKNAGSNFNTSGNFENVLFGSSGKCAGGNSSKIAHARLVMSPNKFNKNNHNNNSF